MFDRIVGGFAEGIGAGLVQLLIMFPIALLICKLCSPIPRRFKHALAAFIAALAALGGIYIVFHYNSLGPSTLTSILFVPFVVSIVALLATDRFLPNLQ